MSIYVNTFYIMQSDLSIEIGVVDQVIFIHAP